MERITLTITQGLTRLIMPISLVAILVALTLIGKTVWLRTRGGSLRQSSYATSDAASKRAGSSALERIAVTLCALVALVGAITMVMNALRRNPITNPLSALFLGFVLLLSLPALMWRSHWRIPAEGLATIALSGVAVLSGFSIGFVFVPLLVAMLWICVQHLRADAKPPLSDHLPSG